MIINEYNRYSGIFSSGCAISGSDSGSRFFVISLANRLIRRFLSTTILPLDAQNLLRRIIVYGLWFAVLMHVTAVLKLGEILYPLIGASVLVGAAVALAVKDALSDAVAGIFLLLDRHFNIGDEKST